MTDLLVIDDDADFASLLKASLEAFGHGVRVGHTASDAMSLLDGADPDVLLVDLGLPDGDGKDLVRTVRSNGDVPIIVVTSRHEIQERVAALDAGADDYVLKPFSLDELAARVRAQLRRVTAPPPTDVLRFDGFDIHLRSKVVRQNGSPIRFTPTELQMLTMLARNAGSLVTHQQLYREVWPDGFAESGHYVRVYIQQIRRKLGDAASDPTYIATEHSFGYRWLPAPL